MPNCWITRAMTRTFEWRFGNVLIVAPAFGKFTMEQR